MTITFKNFSELRQHLRKHHGDQEFTIACPLCNAAKGGKSTARLYSSTQLSEWGSRGGRPRKEDDDVKTDADSSS